MTDNLKRRDTLLGFYEVIVARYRKQRARDQNFYAAIGALGTFVFIAETSPNPVRTAFARRQAKAMVLAIQEHERDGRRVVEDMLEASALEAALAELVPE